MDIYRSSPCYLLLTMEDKAVATEEVRHNTCLEVARLEAVLNSLVENKVEAIKNDSLANTPKSLAKRLRLTSTTSTNSSKDRDTNRKRKRRKEMDKGTSRKQRRSKQRVSSSSPESPRFTRNCDVRTPPLSEEDAFVQYDAAANACCCGEDIVEVRINPMPKYDEDYVSLKIDDYDVVELEPDATAAAEEEDARRRARRKRRRRRRKRRRMKAALATVAVVEDVKIVDPDELPQRARWTIVATACLLLFMCLMLVGVTLRMAPLIDDMVRKENEELMNSLQREPAGHLPSLTPPS